MSTPEPGRSRRHVVHLTSVHTRYDTRIFRKQCCSLARAGFRVTLVVADGKGDEVTAEGVEIVDVGASAGRLQRILGTTRRVKRAAVSLSAELYHFHDPELIPLGLWLKRRDKKVIFDSHEDGPKQMLTKPYLTPTLLKGVAAALGFYEMWAARRLDCVVGATPYITAKFAKQARRALNINNYPQLGELENALPWDEKANEVCYVGQIAEIRGILPLVEALDRTESGASLNLVGAFAEAATEAKAHTMPGWRRVHPLGYMGRGEVRDVMARSLAGIVTFAPAPNHIDAQPNKMFEYMSAGIPVIASDFPLWRDIIVGTDSGLCVDPMVPSAIAGAIDAIARDPARAQEMGANGKAAVARIYNWEAEFPKMAELYEELLDG